MMELKTIFVVQSVGVDTVSAIQRFSGNTLLYERFLKSFPADKNFSRIGVSMESNDWEEMLNAVHTLKGLSGNLGMVRLFQACSETVILLREKNMEAAKESYRELEAAYEEIYSALNHAEEALL